LSAKGSCPELTGGGLVRSAGGWGAVKEAYRDGIRLSGDERILGSSEFVETTLKQAGEAYDRKMRIKSAGMDLSGVIAAVCCYLNIDEKELAGPTRLSKIARARALVGYIATRLLSIPGSEVARRLNVDRSAISRLSIPGSEVARRLNVDRSAISRAVQRAGNDTDLIAAAATILEPLEP